MVCHVPGKQEAWQFCWQRVLEFQLEVHRSTIPRMRNSLVEQVLVEPVLQPQPPPGAVVLNK